MSAQAQKVEFLKAELRRRNPLIFERFHDIQWQLLRDTNEITVALGGNRSAKSGWLCRAVAGIVSHTYPVPNMYPNTPIQWRHISHADLLRDMSQPLIESMLPRDYIVRRKAYPGGGFDEMWWFRDGGFLSFVTRNQDPKDMAGVELHGFSFDEPTDEAMWSENWRRLSAPWRKVLGGMTVLDGAAWFIDRFVTERQPNATIIEMPIWANCKCLAGLDVDKLRRLGKPVELAKQTHPENCGCNHGFISQPVIRSYLAGVSSWEIEAVEWGTPLFLQRRIYPEFAADRYNTFDPESMDGWDGTGRNKVPRKGTLWVCLDPHDATPDAVHFTIVTPDNRRWTVRELPDYRAGQWKGHYLDQLKTGRTAPSVTVRMIAEVVKELGMQRRMGGFMGFDPHYTHYSYDSAEKAVDIVKQYNDAIEKGAEWLPRFRRVDTHRDAAGEIEAGHKAVAEWLICDKANPFTIENSPKWRFSTYCDNTIRALMNYRRKEDPRNEELGLSNQPAQQFKHFPDVIRYEDGMKIHYIDTTEYQRDNIPKYSSAAA